MTKRLRQLLVIMHLTVAFGWVAATFAVMLLVGYDPGAAAVVDDRLLADFSFMTVYTGVMLAGLGVWGYTRFWWVAVKLVTAIGCALVGRALPVGSPVAGAVLVAVILAMAWIGRVKPWGLIRSGQSGAGEHRSGRPWQHPAIYVVALVTPVLDYVTDLPLQALPVAVVLSRRLIRRSVPG